MAYGLKYENLCATRINRDLFILRLSVDGYAGGIVDRDIPANPFVLNKERASYIRGTSLDFQIREAVDFEFLSFYSNNSKYIKAELFRNVITTFTNVSYETFTRTGRTIASAIETGSGGGCVSNDFALKAGETLRIKFTLTKTSGQTPSIGISDGTHDYYTSLADGANDVALTALVAGNYHVYFYNSAAASWHTGDVWGMRPIWSGWVNPQQYSVPYITCPANVKFTAMDGLGLLKQEDFTLTGNNSELTIIRYCLDKIALSLRYAIAIDVIELNQDDTRSVLAQTFRNSVEFEEMNCYEVLESILSNYNAEISQCHNRWQIIRSTCKKLTRMLYTSAGVYDTTEEAPTPLDLGSVLGSGTEVRPVGNLWLDLEPGGKSVKIKHDYGRKLSFLQNYDFSKFTGEMTQMFDSWTKSGSFTVEQREIEGLKYAFLEGFSNVDTDYIEQEIDVIYYDGSFVLELDASGLLEYNTSLEMAVRLQISLTGNSGTNYLSTSGWTSTPTIIAVALPASIAVPSFNSSSNRIKILTDGIPEDGTLTIKLYRYKTGLTSGYLGVAFARALIYFLDGSSQLFPEKSELTYTFRNSSETNKLADVELTGADAPDYENNNLLYEKITRLTAGGIPTLQWYMGNDDSIYTLVQLLAKTLASEKRIARQKLTGEIRGTADISFDDIIKHAYNSDREFEIAEAVWDIYEEKMRVTLLEILAYSDEIIDVSDESVIDSAADLTVQSVSLGENPIIPEKTLSFYPHIHNTGSTAGRRKIEWELRLHSDDSVIDSGTELTQLYQPGTYADPEITIAAPATEGTYYIAAKIETDTSWVLSADLVVAEPDITINSLATIVAGSASSPMTIELNATNTGGEGPYHVDWTLYDSLDQVVSSGDEDINISYGTGDYSVPGVSYPGTPGSGYYIVVAGITSNAFNVSA